MSTVVRPARPDEIPFLTEKAREVGWERSDLHESLVWVVEVDGIASGFIDIGVVFQIKNLCIFPEFRRHAPPSALRRAVFQLAKVCTDWIRGPQNTTGIRCAIAYVETKRFQRLCQQWGMAKLPRKGRWMAQYF